MKDKQVSDAARLANMLRDFVDTMIPGDGDWPSASLVGVQGVLAMRLLETLGEKGLDQLDKAILECGGPLSELNEARPARIDRAAGEGAAAILRLDRDRDLPRLLREPRSGAAGAIARPALSGDAGDQRLSVRVRSISSATGRVTVAGTTSCDRGGASRSTSAC